MKKYIRTEDGRVLDIGKFMDDEMNTDYYKDFEFAELENRDGKTYINWTAVGTEYNDILRQRGVRCQFGAYVDSPFIKQSDDIEELFDEYVVRRRMFGEWFHVQYRVGNISPYEEIEFYKRVGIEFEAYGAIWTDKGLIYVAKLNKEGKWESL